MPVNGRLGYRQDRVSAVLVGLLDTRWPPDAPSLAIFHDAVPPREVPPVPSAAARHSHYAADDALRGGAAAARPRANSAGTAILIVGAIRCRFSRTQGRSHLSSGCRHCGALIGNFTSTTPGTHQETVLTLPIRIGPAWRSAIERHPGYRADLERGEGWRWLSGHDRMLQAA